MRYLRIFGYQTGQLPEVSGMFEVSEVSAFRNRCLIPDT